MNRLIVIGLLFLSAISTVCGQVYPQLDPLKFTSDSVHVIPRRPWLAAGEVVGINLMIGSFNRFIMHEDFAMISGKTIKSNFKTGPVWDTDKFVTNLIAHPYHGSLYFNSARSNGLSFWQSAPYALGGSLMWEYLMETEPPSINDLFATTFGGIELGEILFRLSDLFIDDRTTGSERVGREILAGVISPIRGINRLVSGESWKYRSTKGRALPSVPVRFTVNAGGRFLAEQDGSKHGTTSMSLSFRLDYGDLYNDDYFSPYEWFQFKAALDFFSTQPLISQVSAIGALWGKTVWSKDERNLTVGVFQHFDYYDSELRSSTPNYVAPYRISEAAAVGGGLIYTRKALPANKVDLYAELYVNSILLGASVSDHLKIRERDYNLGSGYSVKAYVGLVYNKRWSFMMNTDNYHIFTWKGYDPDLDFSTVDPETLNVQGEESNVRLTIFSTHLVYISKKNWHLMLTNRNFSRYTRYRYYDNVTTNTYDVMLTLGFRI